MRTLMIEQKTGIKPFVMRFGEPVKGEVASISGKYNKHLQVWEYSPGKDLSKSFPVVSFPEQEKPKTVSTVVTRPPNPRELPKTDMGPDD